MCGIYCKISQNTSLKEIIHGIEQIQNRGYDSCGILMANSRTVNIIKEINEIDSKLNAIEKIKLHDKNQPKFNFGMAHTRWCTHGIINKANTHPHTCYKNKLHMIHNGIVENFNEIKQFLNEKNIQTIGDTDTEIIVNFFSYCIDNVNSDEIYEKLKKCSKKICGRNAFIIYYNERIFIFKNTVNLLIYESENEIIIASEKYSLPDGKYYTIKDGFHELYKNNLSELKKEMFINKAYTIPICDGNNMKREILQQRTFLSNTKNLSSDILKIFNNSENILLIGCGSCYNLAMVGAEFIRQNTGKNVFAIDACNFSKHKIPNYIHKSNNLLCIVLSQSGETIDTFITMNKIKELVPFAVTMCVVNSVSSVIYNKSDYKIEMQVGRENAVASTKTFTCIFKIFYLLCEKNLLFKPYNYDTVDENIQLFTKYIPKISISSIFILGDGVFYPIAIEACLKLKEVAYINCDAYPLGALKHGPFAMIDKNNTNVFIIHTEKSIKTKSTYSEIKCRGANVVILSNSLLQLDGSGIDESDIINFNSDENIFMFQIIIFFQLLSMYTGIQKKINVDTPRNLAKCVTVI